MSNLPCSSRRAKWCAPELFPAAVALNRVSSKVPASSLFKAVQVPLDGFSYGGGPPSPKRRPIRTAPRRFTRPALCHVFELPPQRFAHASNLRSAPGGWRAARTPVALGHNQCRGGVLCRLGAGGPWHTRGRTGAQPEPDGGADAVGRCRRRTARFLRSRAWCSGCPLCPTTGTICCAKPCWALSTVLPQFVPRHRPWQPKPPWTWRASSYG